MAASKVGTEVTPAKAWKDAVGIAEDASVVAKGRRHTNAVFCALHERTRVPVDLVDSAVDAEICMTVHAQSASEVIARSRPCIAFSRRLPEILEVVRCGH